MAFENFKNRFIEAQQEIEAVVKSSVDQLLQKEVTFDKQMNKQEDLKSSVGALGFPSVALSFKTGGTINHLVFMEPDFVNQFYAWMIADEPAEQVGEEQIEGIKEAFDQVFGQIKISIADDQSNFTIDDVNIENIEGAEALDAILDSEPAMHSDYSFSTDEKSFKINYFAWPIPGTETQTNGSSMSETAQAPTSEMEKVTVQPAEFDNLSGSGTDYGSGRNVDMLLDVNLEVTVELDRKMMLVSDLLKLGKGSIIELEKSAGEPLDIFINGRKFAEGEVVVIDDKFGIRLTQLLSPKDRIKSLGV